MMCLRSRKWPYLAAICTMLILARASPADVQHVQAKNWNWRSRMSWEPHLRSEAVNDTPKPTRVSEQSPELPAQTPQTVSSPLPLSAKTPAIALPSVVSGAASVESIWEIATITWPEASGVTCVGEPYETLSCAFENLIYDQLNKKFLFFVRSNDTTSAVMLRSLPYWENFELEVVDDKSTTFPHEENTCHEVDAIYLTNALRPYSFGHTVRDFFTVFTANVVQLGVQLVSYKVAVVNVLPYLGLSDYDIARGMRVLRKYTEWISEGALWFHEITGSCRPEKQYILFHKLVAGSLMFDMKPETFDKIIFPKRWGGCNSTLFETHRNMAYELARLPPVLPAWKHNQIKVMFGDKATDDSRRVDNVAELIPALQARFPTFRFVNKVLTHLSAREQLEEMSSVSIFISPHASSSFRMVYLPTGAHSIIIGPPEMDGHNSNQAFSEIDVCWDHIPYFSVGRYHVTERSEYIVRFERGYQPDNKQIVDYYHWFDSDSHLIAEKLGDLIVEGVKLIRSRASEGMQANGMGEL